MDFRIKRVKIFLSVLSFAASIGAASAVGSTIQAIDPNKLSAECKYEGRLSIYEEIGIKNYATVGEDWKVNWATCKIKKLEFNRLIANAKRKNRLLLVNYNRPLESKISDTPIKEATVTELPSSVKSCEFVNSKSSSPRIFNQGCKEALLISSIRCKGDFEFSTVVACSAKNAKDPVACYKEYLAESKPMQASGDTEEQSDSAGVTSAQ